MQKICVRCHKRLGFLDKMECKDGTFCFKCTENLNKKVRYNLEKYSTDEIIDRIEHPEKYEEENKKCSNKYSSYSSIIIVNSNRG